MKTYNKHNAAIRAEILRALADIRTFSGPAFMLLSLDHGTKSASLMRGYVFGNWQDTTTAPGAAQTFADMTAFAGSGFFLQIAKDHHKSEEKLSELAKTNVPVFSKDFDWGVIGFKDSTEAFLFKTAAAHMQFVSPTPD